MFAFFNDEAGLAPRTAVDQAGPRPMLWDALVALLGTLTELPTVADNMREFHQLQRGAFLCDAAYPERAFQMRAEAQSLLCLESRA